MTDLRRLLQPSLLSSFFAGGKLLHALVVTGLWILIFIPGLWSPGLLDDADSMHAEAAREMARTGDFVRLRVNDVLYPLKAPLPYWLVAIAYRVLGENEFATRLPSALSVLGLMWLAGRWARQAADEVAARYAPILTATSLGVFLFTRIFIPEVMLSFFMGLAFLYLVQALDENKAWKWYAYYALMALSVLTKGLLPLALAGGTIVPYLLITGEWRRWREFRLVTGGALFLLIAAPWHLLAEARITPSADGRGFFWLYFVNEHFLRFLGQRFPKDYNRIPAAVFLASHFIWLFPWSFFLPAAARDVWRDWNARTKDGSLMADRASMAHARLFCVCLAVVVVLFFTISTNQEYYTFPAYLPLIVLLSYSLAKGETGGRKERLWINNAHAAIALVSMTVAAALCFALWSSRNLPFQPDVSMLLERRAIGDYTLSMSPVFDLTDQAMAGLRLPTMVAVLALGLGPATGWWLRSKGMHRQATLSLAFAVALLLFASQLAFNRFEPQLSSKRTALEIARLAGPNDQILVYGDLSGGASLPFYLRRQVKLVNGKSSSMLLGSTLPNSADVFVTDEELVTQWGQKARLFLFVTPSDVRRVEELLGNRGIVVIRHGEKVVFANRPL